MSIPGLGGLSVLAPDTTPTQAREIELPAGSEWRFEVPADGRIEVKLQPSSGVNNGIPAGTAEVAGTELASNHAYGFTGLTKAAIYTHTGCKLSVSGTCDSDYTAEETAMAEYLNLHFALENMRDNHDTGTISGPRVLILGPEDSGKTTIAKVLTAYASRSTKTLMVVNLDPREGMLCLPGCISAIAVGPGAMMDVEDAASNGWGSSPISGPSTLPVKMPLIYHYGYENPESRPEIFKPVTSRLALAVTGRLNDDPDVKSAGMLVDIAGSVCTGKKGTEIVSHIVSEFSINVIVVIGSERLYSEMSKRFGAAPLPGEEQVRVIRLSKSGGCVDRDEAYLKQLRQVAIREYFFGTVQNTLSPVTISVEFASLTIMKMVERDALDYDTGEKRAPQSALFEAMAPSMALQGALLVVKHANVTDPPEVIRDASVMGYLYVADVDESKKRLRVLSPVGGRLPGNAVVWGPWEVAAGVNDMLT